MRTRSKLYAQNAFARRIQNTLYIEFWNLQIPMQMQNYNNI